MPGHVGPAPTRSPVIKSKESRFLQPDRKRFTVGRIIGSGDLWMTGYVLR